MTEKIEMDEALTPPEAAKFLGITQDRLRYLRRQGRVKGIQASKRFTLYRLSDLRQADIKERPKGRKSTSKESA